MLVKFFKKNIKQLKIGGIKIFVRKIKTLCVLILTTPIFFLTIPTLLILQLIKPWILVRFCNLVSSRIGHFTVNTELYLCEKDLHIIETKQKYIDFFYFKDICNTQLAKMWRRKIKVLPRFLLSPLHIVCLLLGRYLPALNDHIIKNIYDTDRDVNNIFDKAKVHLFFTKNEKKIAKKKLEQFGLNEKSKFVCLIVRDSTYLDNLLPENEWKYHDYRNWNINNFVMCAEKLAERGYFVFRMGKKVEKSILSNNPKIIDYANSNLRSDFLDIYLGANCDFCISTTTGFDGIPLIFRRPILYLDVPIIDLPTYSDRFLLLTKHHVWKENKKRLTLSEILLNASDFFKKEDFDKKGIDLVENTPEEISDVAMEMADRIEGVWLTNKQDEILQDKFWNLFLNLSNKKLGHKIVNKLHGKIKAKFGANFLRNNSMWLQ